MILFRRGRVPTRPAAPNVRLFGTSGKLSPTVRFDIFYDRTCRGDPCGLPAYVWRSHMKVSLGGQLLREILRALPSE